VLIVFRGFFTWITLGYVDLHFCHDGEKSQHCSRVNEPHDYISNIISPYTWPMAWQWCHFPLACCRR